MTSYRKETHAMEHIRPSSDLRNHYNEVARDCRDSREPVFITVNGREDTVIMGSLAYRQMREELELLRALAVSEEDVACGRVVSMEETFSKARKMLEEMKATGEIR